MWLLLVLLGYGLLLHFEQIWGKETNYVILFYNLKADHFQLGVETQKVFLKEMFWE